MSREIDTEGRLNKEDLIYLAQREAMPGNSIPDKYADRLDEEQLRAILSGEEDVKSLKLLPASKPHHEEVADEEETSGEG